LSAKTNIFVTCLLPAFANRKNKKE